MSARYLTNRGEWFQQSAVDLTYVVLQFLAPQILPDEHNLCSIKFECNRCLRWNFIDGLTSYQLIDKTFYGAVVQIRRKLIRNDLVTIYDPRSQHRIKSLEKWAETYGTSVRHIRLDPFDDIHEPLPVSIWAFCLPQLPQMFPNLRTLHIEGHIHALSHDYLRLFDMVMQWRNLAALHMASDYSHAYVLQTPSPNQSQDLMNSLDLQPVPFECMERVLHQFQHLQDVRIDFSAFETPQMTYDRLEEREHEYKSGAYVSWEEKEKEKEREIDLDCEMDDVDSQSGNPMSDVEVYDVPYDDRVPVPMLSSFHISHDVSSRPDFRTSIVPIDLSSFPRLPWNLRRFCIPRCFTCELFMHMIKPCSQLEELTFFWKNGAASPRYYACQIDGRAIRQLADVCKDRLRVAWLYVESICDSMEAVKYLMRKCAKLEHLILNYARVEEDTPGFRSELVEFLAEEFGIDAKQIRRARITLVHGVVKELQVNMRPPPPEPSPPSPPMSRTSSPPPSLAPSPRSSLSETVSMDEVMNDAVSTRRGSPSGPALRFGSNFNSGEFPRSALSLPPPAAAPVRPAKRRRRPRITRTETRSDQGMPFLDAFHPSPPPEFTAPTTLFADRVRLPPELPEHPPPDPPIPLFVTPPPEMENPSGFLCGGSENLSELFGLRHLPEGDFDFSFDVFDEPPTRPE